MSTFADPFFYGGYWPWGGVPNAIPVPAPANAAERPDLDKPLVRKETWGGGTGRRQTPYSKAPPGTYHTYGLMARNPTIAKAYGIVMHPILAGTWNVKIRTEAGEARAYKPSLIGQVGDGVISSPEDAWAETLLQTFDPLRSYLLAGAGRGLFNGHSPFHTEWARRNGATVVGRLRRFTDTDLIAGRVQMLKDDQTGDFAGVRFEGNDYDPRYAVNFVNQPEVDPIIGHSNCENCRDEWWEKLQAKDRGRNLDQRATSTVPIVKGPATADGEAKAKDIAAALARDEGVYMPQYLFDTADMSPQHPDAAKFTAFDIDTVDLGNTAPAQAAILDKLRYLDAELLAGFYLAPLQAAESIHGTRAQAGVHADANILYSELVYHGIIEQFNHSLVRLMTLTNRGPAEAERYYFEAGALSDPKQEYLQKLVLALAATPGDPIAGPIDRPKLLADTGAPVDVNYKPQPALPTGPTPPEGGPGGGNGQQQPGANGNGNPDRMRQLGLSAGRWGEDADGEGLRLDCGRWRDIDGHPVCVGDLDTKGGKAGSPVSGESVYGTAPEGVSQEKWERAVQNRLVDMDRRVYGHDSTPHTFDEKLREQKQVLRAHPELIEHYAKTDAPAPDPRETANSPSSQLRAIAKGQGGKPVGVKVKLPSGEMRNIRVKIGTGGALGVDTGDGKFRLIAASDIDETGWEVISSNKEAVSLSAGEDGQDDESPFDDGGDYALSLNCGTGAGGFAPGNTCSKGGHQFVVSKVTRAGMVHGRAVGEDESMPPVELGHASEFTPAETPLSQAPLPEFAAKVQAIADGLPGFGDNKVYVSTAFDAAHEADPSLTMGDFKAKLKAANTAQLLKLSRADIPLNPAEVARSEIELGHGATAHYLLVKSDPNRRQAVRVR